MGLPRELLLQPPLLLAKELWPQVTLYDRQKEIVHSVWTNYETDVPAGNMLGKDFVAGMICPMFLITRHPCRIVTTSAKDDHLRVLWGEINWFIQNCKYPLDFKQGGPLVVNHQDVKKVVNGNKCPLTYMIGLVAGPDSIAAMQGHHIANTGDGIPRTLFISDESSSVPDEYYKMATSWANRILILGNTWECHNFFKKNVKGGDVADDLAPLNKDGKPSKYYRKIIRIRAVDSPNVRLALAQKAKGIQPTGDTIVPGVKGWEEYQRNLKMWDSIEQCVKLEAEFWEGRELLLYPPDWLTAAAKYADELRLSGVKRKAKSVGVDPGEGDANTVFCACDEYGLLDMVAYKTRDTNRIFGDLIAFARKHFVPMHNVLIDRGGGGKQLADRLRASGHEVRTVAFGEAVAQEPKYGSSLVPERRETREVRYAYRNRRAEMYGKLRELMDPARTDAPYREDLNLEVFKAIAGLAGNRNLLAQPRGFAIAAQHQELRRQLSLMPLKRDNEGRMMMLPKNRRSMTSREQTLIDLLGRSPDEADALVLAVYGLTVKGDRPKIGAY